ncbi:hypothetical protein E2C01_049499 [Portunus trituberculatus]|uniref:Uncharacterized protein n=1 Tax=Portunus trituberculatus TaxID=210409 RepID=A0A5B7GDB1_PORTR|nr:hypothetical protein [Portunus trituberculatus]
MTLLLAGGRRGGVEPPLAAGSTGAELGGTGKLEGVSRVDQETSPDNPSRRREAVSFVSGSKYPVTRVSSAPPLGTSEGVDKIWRAALCRITSLFEES